MIELSQIIAELAAVAPFAEKDPISPEQQRFLALLKKAQTQARLVDKQIHMLQSIVDRNISNDIGVIDMCVTQADAFSMVDRYDSDWFENCPYSQDAQQKIAMALQSMAMQFTIRNPFWDTLANLRRPESTPSASTLAPALNKGTQ